MKKLHQLALAASIVTSVACQPESVNDTAVDTGNEPVTCPHGPNAFIGWAINNSLDPAEVREKTGLTHNIISTDENWLEPYLEYVRESGLKVIVSREADRAQFTDSNGNFDLDAYLELLRKFEEVEALQNYTGQDGPIDGYMLADDLLNYSNYGPTRDELETIAEEANWIFHGQAETPSWWINMVRDDPTDSEWAGRDNGPYEYVSAFYAQTKFLKDEGDPESWALEQAAAAERMGVSLIMGINGTDYGYSADCAAEGTVDGTMQDHCLATVEQIHQVTAAFNSVCPDAGRGWWRFSDQEPEIMELVLDEETGYPEAIQAFGGNR